MNIWKWIKGFFSSLNPDVDYEKPHPSHYEQQDPYALRAASEFNEIATMARISKLRAEGCTLKPVDLDKLDRKSSLIAERSKNAPKVKMAAVKNELHYG